MTSFIFQANELRAEEMDVNSSIRGSLPQSQRGSRDEDISKSAYLRRKNLSITSSKNICAKDQGIIYGLKFSDKKPDQEENYESESISHSVKIDCNGSASIINNLETLSNEYVPAKTMRAEEQRPILKTVTSFNIEDPQPVRSPIQVREKKMEKLVMAEEGSVVAEESQDAINRRFTAIFAFILIFLVLSITSQVFGDITKKYIIAPFGSFRREN